MPLISVIVPVYNGGEELKRCIDTILAQEGAAFEILVADGGSTDGTVDFLRTRSDQLAFWDSQRDGGITQAWNRALRHAQGDWIQFLGADDVLAHSRVFADMQTMLGPAHETGVVFGKIRIDGGVWDGLEIGEPWRWDTFRFRMTVPHQSAFHHRSLFDRFGGFDERLRLSADYELLLRCGPDLRAFFVDKLIAITGGQGISISSPVATYREALAAQLLHRTANPLLLRLVYAYRVLRALPWMSAKAR